ERIRSLKGGQGRVQADQGALVEAGADLAGVSQLAVAVVVAQQQRAEPDARALRVGVAADDELLSVLALDLQPVPGPPGPVGRAGPLGDDPFPALGAGLPEVCLAVGVPVLGEAQGVAERQQPAQQPLALAQRQWPHVAAVGHSTSNTYRYTGTSARSAGPGSRTPSRRCSRAKLSRSPSKATISPSVMKSP